MMSMEHWWNDTKRGKTKYSDRKLPHCHMSTIMKSTFYVLKKCSVRWNVDGKINYV
jgi:hypothetical protein